MDAMQFEPMSVSRIFDRTFAIYRNHFLRFITIVAMIEVPLTLLTMASTSWVNSQMPAASRSADAQETSDAPYAGQDGSGDTRTAVLGFLGNAFALVLRIVGVMLCQAVLIKNISEVYLGNDIAVGQAYRFVFPKALTLVLATICVTLVTWLGFLLLIVPGVIFGLWFSLTTSAIVVEGYSATAGMSRSKALVAGNLGKVFVVGLLAGLITYVISLPLGFVAGFLGVTVFSGNPTAYSLMIHTATALAQILSVPITAAAYILLYYDLRIRKEGFDLQMLSQSMASSQG